MLIAGFLPLATYAILPATHTQIEEAEGKEVWEKLRSNETECSKLTDDDFGALGEHFMGQMLGASHETMNNMMVQSMGERGEEAMHEIMGKRLSGCDTAASFPSIGTGFMPMLSMMMGGSMMGGAGWGSGVMPYSRGAWSTMRTFVLWWPLAIGVISAVITWIILNLVTKKKE